MFDISDIEELVPKFDPRIAKIKVFAVDDPATLLVKLKIRFLLRNGKNMEDEIIWTQENFISISEWQLKNFVQVTFNKLVQTKWHDMLEAVYPKAEYLKDAKSGKFGKSIASVYGKEGQEQAFDKEQAATGLNKFVDKLVLEQLNKEALEHLHKQAVTGYGQGGGPLASKYAIEQAYKYIQESKGKNEYWAAKAAEVEALKQGLTSQPDKIVKHVKAQSPKLKVISPDLVEKLNEAAKQDEEFYEFLNNAFQPIKNKYYELKKKQAEQANKEKLAKLDANPKKAKGDFIYPKATASEAYYLAAVQEAGASKAGVDPEMAYKLNQKWNPVKPHSFGSNQSFSGHSQAALESVLPCMAEEVHYPCQKHKGKKELLPNIIMHLNDAYFEDEEEEKDKRGPDGCGMSRSEIADWLESLDIDISVHTSEDSDSNG